MLHHFYAIYKDKLKMDKRLKCSHTTIKILEENIGIKSQAPLIAIFLLIYFLGQRKQRKSKQMGLHHTKKLCTSKETTNKIKREPSIWENIFAKDKSDRG